jgi:hypothetical protein
LDASAAFAICVRPAPGGRQCWELLDDDGERVMHGLANDQAEALSMAHTAVESLRRAD